MNNAITGWALDDETKYQALVREALTQLGARTVILIKGGFANSGWSGKIEILVAKPDASGFVASWDWGDHFSPIGEVLYGDSREAAIEWLKTSDVIRALSASEVVAHLVDMRERIENEG